jgi:hypothetical protein
MRSLVLHDVRSWWRWGSAPRSLLRHVLLWGLEWGARGIGLARQGDHVEFWFRLADRVERLLPPSAYLADELVAEVRRLARRRERVADWFPQQAAEAVEGRCVGACGRKCTASTSPRSAPMR